MIYRAVLSIVGLICFTVAAWIIYPVAGVAVLGACCILVARDLV